MHTHVVSFKTSLAIVRTPAENWVWQPTYANPPDIHLPEKWGYVQLADHFVNKTKEVCDPQWPVRDALSKVYYAEVEVPCTFLKLQNFVDEFFLF